MSETAVTLKSSNSSVLRIPQSKCARRMTLCRQQLAHPLDTRVLASGALPELSPPRDRMKPPNSENRKYTWATHRIHELELELEKAKHTIKVMSEVGACMTLPCFQSEEETHQKEVMGAGA